LKGNSVILRKCTAFFLLLVFTFSITPRKYLHDAIATHQDKVAVSASDKVLQINPSGFSCKADNQVAESPFTAHHQEFHFGILPNYAAAQDVPAYHFYAVAAIQPVLRGPPSFI
jgi:hypothetical protein